MTTSPQTPETHALALAPGQRLPEAARKALSPEAEAEIQALAGRYPDRLAATLIAALLVSGPAAGASTKSSPPPSECT